MNPHSYPKKKVAVIGSGISGMSAAWYLSQDSRFDVHVYEAADRPGGHTATIDVNFADESLAIDTGFIVFNDRTYPNFIALLDSLGISRMPTEMSFSVSDQKSGIEYAGSNLNGLFAQRRNLWSKPFMRMVSDILRFNAEVERDLECSSLLSNASLDEYLRAYCYSKEFRDWYLLPMGAAIWSADNHTMENFPLQFFVRFFRNHGLLQVRNRPQWYVVEGGSKQYIPALIRPYEEQLYLNTPVYSVRRQKGGDGHSTVCVTSARGDEVFDELIFACHSDQALALLGDASKEESSLLAQIPYSKNEVVLHRDTSLLPDNRRAWSSWNVSLPEYGAEKPALTYNMNILQKIKSKATWCVTLNQTESIDPSLIEGVYHYDHPVFGLAGIAAQEQLKAINGQHKVWFCGAWMRNGFHEDGVTSALEVTQAMTSAPDISQYAEERIMVNG